MRRLDRPETHARPGPGLDPPLELRARGRQCRGDPELIRRQRRPVILKASLVGVPPSMTTSVTLSLGYVAVYVALAGVASFIEKPAGRGFGPSSDTLRKWAKSRNSSRTCRYWACALALHVTCPVALLTRRNSSDASVQMPGRGICCSHQTTFPAGVRREPHRWDMRLTI